MIPRINDVVRLVENLPNDALSKGMIGTIVAEYSKPEEAYEVEFCDEYGTTIIQVPLRRCQFILERGECQI